MFYLLRFTKLLDSTNGGGQVLRSMYSGGAFSFKPQSHVVYNLHLDPVITVSGFPPLLHSSHTGDLPFPSAPALYINGWLFPWIIFKLCQKKYFLTFPQLLYRFDCEPSFWGLSHLFSLPQFHFHIICEEWLLYGDSLLHFFKSWICLLFPNGVRFLQDYSSALMQSCLYKWEVKRTDNQATNGFHLGTE